MNRTFGFILSLFVAITLLICTATIRDWKYSNENQFQNGVAHFEAELSVVKSKLNEELNRIIYLKEQHRVDDIRKHQFDLYRQLDEQGIVLFVLDRQQPVFWSSNRLSLGEIKPFSNGLYHYKNGWYFVQSVERGDGQYIATALLQNTYENENSFLKNHFSHFFKFSESWKIDTVAGNSKFSKLLDIVDGKNVYLVFNSDAEIQSSIPLLISESFIVLFILLIPLLFFRKTGKYKWLFIAYFIVIRLVFFYSSYPVNLKSHEIFQPQLYAFSDWIPSLGDLVLHALFMCAVLLYGGKNFISKSTKSKTNTLKLTVILLASSISVYFLSGTVESLVHNSTIPFNLFDISVVNYYTVVCVVAVFLVFSCIYYFIYRVLTTNEEEIELKQIGISIILIVAIAFLSVIIFKLNLWLVTWSVIFQLLIVVRVYQKSTFSVLKFIPEVLIFSVFLSSVLHFNLLEKETENLRHIIEKKAEEKDPIAEFLLGNLVKENQKREFRDSSELHFYLSNKISKYLNRYDFELAKSNEDEQKAVELTQEKIHSGLYYLLNKDEGKYILFIPTREEDILWVVSFKAKSLPDAIGFPLLLADKTVEKTALDYKYSFAKYNKGKLVEQKGVFNYSWSADFFPKLSEGQHYDFENVGFRHYLFKKKGKLYVISQKNQGVWHFISEFSYLFFFYLILLFFAAILYQLFSKKLLFGNSVKNRIQAALVFTLLSSMIVIAWASIFTLKTQYNFKNFDSISEKIKSVQLEMIHFIGKNPNFTVQELDNEISKISTSLFTDINLFDSKGRLVSSSQPKIFESGIISNLMNSQAYFELAINRKMQQIQMEKIEKLEYLSAYAPLYQQNGKVLAYINLPYFTKSNELKNEINSFLITLINLYLLLTAAAMLITLFIANRITAPLTVIKDRISKMSISNTNEQIVWKSDDEIGALIQEYNKKVKELRVSAQKLAQVERENAWKEMAKQVAHEIKNPLTPMKLNIQHFQMIWGQMSENEKNDKFPNFAKNLVDQIDTLTGIASQFSSFATLQEPSFTEVNLVSLLESAMGLYDGQENLNLLPSFAVSSAFVSADKDQILRVFNNIIKNGIQAIPNHTKGELKITLQEDFDGFIISISDNGSGISPEIQDKIFQPNFTTKTSGMGLGLAMVKRLVENNRGRILFETTVNQGTTFFLTFPKISPKS